ncbi:MAG TPA: hypothetical protein VF749_21165 [Candidatus Acidoferrum sp.]
MRQNRRNFFVSAALLSSTLAWTKGVFGGQNPPTPPPKPEPAYTPNPAESYPQPAESAAAKRARFLENEKEFRQGVERLYQLTSDLRDELQKTPAAEFFSVHIVKETEQIEKLAKSLRSKAKSA